MRRSVKDILRQSVVLIGIVFVLGSLEARALPVREVFQLRPDSIRLGVPFDIVYRLKEPTAAFRNTTQVRASILLFNKWESGPLGLPIPELRTVFLTRNDTSWRGSFTVDDPAAVFLVFSFSSDREDDNNNGDFWPAIVRDTNGRPLPRALECSALFHLGMTVDTSFMGHRYSALAENEVAEEVRLHPDNIAACDLLFQLKRNREMGISEAQSAHIDSVMERFAVHATDTTAPRITRWWTTLGKPQKVKAFDDAWLAAHDRGAYSTWVKFTRAKTVRNPNALVTAMRNLLAFTASDSDFAADAVREWLFTWAVQAGEVGLADSVLALPRFRTTARLTRLISSHLEYNRDLPGAMRIARDVFDREARRPSWYDVPYLSDRDRGMRENVLVGHIQYLIGELHMHAGAVDSAVFYLTQASRNTQMADSSIIGEALRAASKLREPGDVARALSMLAPGAVAWDTTWAIVKDIAASVKKDVPIDLDRLKEGSERGRLNRATMWFCNSARRFLSPDVTVPMMEGKPVTIGSLRGKVVVLDFWGTWCAPCRVTLPQIDNVFHAFASDTNVRLISIDAHEHIAQIDTLRDMVWSFLHDSTSSPVMISLPVGFDTSGAICDAFDVHMFPTIVMIDQEGIIRVMWNPSPADDVETLLSRYITIIRERTCGW